MEAKLNFTQINLHHCIEATSLLNVDMQKMHTCAALIQEPYFYKGKVRGLNLRDFTLIESGPNPRAALVVNKRVGAMKLQRFCDRDT